VREFDDPGVLWRTDGHEIARAIAADLAPSHNIRVNVVAPGATTPLWNRGPRASVSAVDGGLTGAPFGAPMLRG